MGTSSPYPGPKGNRDLLPPWAEDPPASPPGPQDDPGAPPLPSPPGGQQQVNLPPTPQGPPNQQPPQQGATPNLRNSWSNPKRDISRYARSRSPSDLRNTGRSYVGAGGGARKMASSARAGRASTAALAAFLSDGIQRGFVQAATDRGVPTITGRDVQVVLANFIGVIAPSGTTLESAAARKATAETLCDVFRKFDVENQGVEVLDTLSPDDVKEIIEISIVNYANERIQQELINRVEAKSIGGRQADQISEEIKNFLFAQIKLDLRNVNVSQVDWNGSAGRQIVESLFARAYAIIGGEQ